MAMEVLGRAAHSELAVSGLGARGSSARGKGWLRRSTYALLFAGLVVGSDAAAQSTALAGWQYRRIVTVTDSTTPTTPPVPLSPPTAPLSKLQVRIDLNSTNFDFSKARPDGRDLRVTTGESDAPLPFWIERWGGGTATVWVKVPSIVIGGTTLRLYYGNSTAVSAADGRATFEFFDDFQSPGATPGYFQLSAPQTVMVNAVWKQDEAVHTMSVVEVNDPNYRYWGYYGLQRCGGVGIAKSNDLNTWVQDSAPLFNTEQERWPSVLLEGGTFYMAHTVNYCSLPTGIKLRKSINGTSFSDEGTLVPQATGALNQNPTLFHDPVGGKYFLYWFHWENWRWEIHVRQSTTIDGLKQALTTPGDTKVLMSVPVTLAAPQMMYRDGTYFLAVETLEAGVWHTRMYTSEVPDAGFRELPGNPLLGDGAACFFQHIFGNTMHAYYCKDSGTLQSPVWSLEHRTADLSAGRTLAAAPAAERWSATGGAWQTVQATQPDGTTGAVAQGFTVEGQVLQSSFTGTDYVVEVNGRQLTGSVWGLGVRGTDSENLVSINLYENLDTQQNLYAYAWAGGVPTEKAKAEVGAIQVNEWHKLTARVQGDVIRVSVDGVHKLQITDTRANAGSGVALYGEAGTRAQFDNVFVRKFVANEPAVLVGAEKAL
ncbi:DUF2341 domain-containing protein [Pyxidicoccus caerfyrddinensis]|uniref:DUF2341 domain-containing protein n=1 Tax=Pyxidicoccus caerfyrddinensis TaxID=2709663 RepID=UPI0013DD1FBA|nr:DUF2341 domain-containing protein [Pyxidicoccus caerfyrddinensis]